MAVLAVLLSCSFQAACTTDIDDRPDLRAALERYRHEFVKMYPGEVLPVSNPEYHLLAGTMRLVLAAYVDPTNPQLLIDRALEGLWERKENDPAAPLHALTESAIDRMLAGLDPYSSFLDAERVNDLREQIHGEFAGLGIDVAMDDHTGFLRVVSSSENSPAGRAGVRSGDLIVTIDGQQVKGLTLSDAATRVRRGPVGRVVDLQVLRPDSGVPVRVSLIRTVLKVRPVAFRLERDIGYIRIAYFSELTSQSLMEAVESMRQQAGGRLAGVVLDLRNNPGGLLEQGVKVAGQFLGPAEIVSTRGRVAATQYYYSGGSGDLLGGAPLVVLINGLSSSAAEIVAGALQDHRRAVLMGTRSYGKGSVQTIFWLPGGEGIRLTTAHYFRPSGALVECYGISPNVEINPPPARTPLSAAIAGKILPEREACDPAAAPPPPRTWPAAGLCPEVSSTETEAPFGLKRDLPVECALAAIRTRRLETAMRR